MSTAVAAQSLVLLLALIGIGIPIILALGVASFVGLWLLTGRLDVAFSLLGTTAFEALRDYAFAVIPFFVLMGELVARSGAAADLYAMINRAFRRLPGHLAIATVAGNAVFAAVVGVSIASAAIFSRVAYPEMMRHGYNRNVALGCVAGSASLGMLIPPSILMIVWGVLTQISIGKLFVAGFLPGLLLALLFATFLLGYALLRPERFGDEGFGSARAGKAELPPLTTRQYVSGAGTLVLIFLVLGGIWLGWFTPTEAAAMGALFALVLALVNGLRWQGVRAALLDTGRTSAPILFLLIFAQMYSRLLSMGGVISGLQALITGLDVPAWVLLTVMVAVWFLLGMFIDSVSILLLTVPLFAPLAVHLGMDPLQFAIIGILAVETGIITPPFGIVVFTVKAAVNDPGVSLDTIFRGAVPYWVLLLLLIVMIYNVPQIATWATTLQ